MKYKEYKKVLKSKYIDNRINFTGDLNRFLRENQAINIIKIIEHGGFKITIIYSELIEIKNKKQCLKEEK